MLERMRCVARPLLRRHPHMKVRIRVTGLESRGRLVDALEPRFEFRRAAQAAVLVRAAFELGGGTVAVEAEVLLLLFPLRLLDTSVFAVCGFGPLLGLALLISPAQ